MRQSVCRAVLAIAFVTGVGVPADAQLPNFGSGLEVPNYKELPYLVESVSDAARAIGLTTDRLTTRLELRLREAGLVPVGTSYQHYVYLNVSVIGGAFSSNIRLNRFVSYLVDGREYVYSGATTWSVLGSGTHGGSAAYILDAVDSQLDEFLNEYLKTNQR